MAATLLGSKTKYQCKVEVDPKAGFICGRTGIRKKYGELTDDEIKKIIDEGSSFFEPIPAPAPAAKPNTTTTS